MHAARRIPAVTVLLLLVPALALAGTKGCTNEVKDTFSGGCKASILDNAFRDAAQRHGVTADDLTAEQRAGLTKVYAPMASSCDCITKAVSARWDYDDFIANQTAYQPDIQAIMDTCAPLAPK